MLTLTSQDKTFKADFEVLTALELLDVEINPNATESEALACEVAKCVIDWNGRGRVNPNWLMADKANHKYVYALAQAAEAQRPTLPKLKAEQKDTYISLSDDEVTIKVADLTILQFMDIVAGIRNESKGDYPSIIKCQVVSNILLDWNGQGILSPEKLRSNKEMHRYIIAIDNVLIEFFREDFTISEPQPILDIGDHNGGNGNKQPPSLEPIANSGKGFAVNVGGIQAS